MKYFLSILLLVSALGMGAVNAGQGCNKSVASPETFQKAFRTSSRVYEKLNASSEQVVLLARVGSDLSKYGLRYSHMGIAWRDHPKGKWMIVHLLNECGTARSDLYNEGLTNFFLDDLFAFDTLVVVPTTSVQQKMAKNLKNQFGRKVHNPSYNMVAYPFSVKYQNSNQWVLEFISAALANNPIKDRTDAQRWLKQKDYAPGVLKASGFTRLGAQLFKVNVAFDDQPAKNNGNVETITVDSIVNFLKQQHAIKREFVIQPSG